MAPDLLLNRENYRRWCYAVIAGVFIATFHFVLAFSNIDHPPQYDEMYHMLAAESWRESGELRILDGEYTRTAGFTKLIGLQSYVCGTSLECARGLSLFFSMGMVFVVTVFTGLMMGLSAGLVAGILTALNPAVVEASLLVRFYSLHALVFLLFAILCYLFVTYSRQMRFWVSSLLLGMVLLLAVIANYLQILTQVGFLGVMAATIVISGPSLFAWLRRQSKVLIGMGAVAGLVLVIIGLGIVDVREKIITYRTVPGWAEGLENAYLFYYYRIRAWYPVLWPLGAFFALLSISRRPRLSLYCLPLFAVCFVVLSLAGIKGDRFILFTLPFFFIPLAGGLVVAFEMVVGAVSEGFKNLPFSAMNRNFARLLSMVIVIGATLTFVVAQPLVRGAGKTLLQPGHQTVFDGNNADWPAAENILRELAKEYPTILTSSGVKAVWYLSNYDYELNRSVMLETDTAEEFGVDYRTGRPVVSSLDSIRQILQERGPALIILEGHHAGDNRIVPVEVIEYLDKIGSQIKTDAQNLKIWVVSTQITTLDSVVESRDQTAL